MALEQALAQERAERELETQIAALNRQIALDKEQLATIEARKQYNQKIFAHEEDEARHQQALCDIEAQAENQRQENALATLRLRREIDNLINDQRVQERLIEILPQITQHLPIPQHLEQIQICGTEGTNALAPILALLRSLKHWLQEKPPTTH
jgi:hypothetical protein